ncbi:helicase with zinc finger domain 2-like [Gigantopelta aegis]|uniref:helicase with zinc finger domain 2-like n=1 Tax=Gigantopelta aegis TaxID=1735272 RepID=UPI001B88C216|nr:helicase with zinc finger domain 2-like [Gigantopelta aegis]
MNPSGGPDFAQRQERKLRIVPYWDDLLNQREPHIDKVRLLILMQDLKDEGNQLFRESQYSQALTHYCHAVFLTSMLENRFYHDVDPEFLSTLYSNRAICCLKLEMYDRAVDDCNSAIKLQPNNVKAYYRKVQALRAQKKYKEALDTALAANEKSPLVFQPQIDQLKELVNQTSKKSEVSVNAAKSTKSDLQNEWLDGTNVLTTQKQREAVLKKPKMPKKKKASRQQGQTNGQVQGHRQSTRQPTEQTSSSDSDSSDLGEDEKFALTLQKVRTKGDPLKMNRSSGTRDGAAWAFPQSPENDADGFSFNAGFQKVGPVGSRGSPKKSMMGLDNFGQVPTGKPAQQFIEVDWPLKDEFHFRLACQQCFVKTGEGIKGYNYREGLHHNCDYDIMLIKLKQRPDVNWIKVRPRAESFGQLFKTYKICLQFQEGKRCRIGEEKCTFPHHNAEKRLWELDRSREFSIPNFITEMRNKRIYTSLIPGAVLQQETKPVKQEPFIPGLNYTNKKQSSQTSNTFDQSSSRTAPPTSMTSQPSQPMQPLRPSQPSQPPQPSQPFQPMQQPLQQQYPYFQQPPSQNTNPQQQQPPYSPQKERVLPGQPLLQTPGFQRYQDFSVPPPNITSKLPPPPQTNLLGGHNYQQASDADGMKKLENPLKAHYDFRILCKECLVPSNQPGLSVHMPHVHNCEQNVLALYKKGEPSVLMRVRERTNHRDFPGKYIICNSIMYGVSSMCRFGEEKCSFAHNRVEQILWTQEKEGSFNVSEFILQNRSATGGAKGYTVEELLKKHGGQFRFICQQCFYDRPPRIAELGNKGYCSGNKGHLWENCKVLAHFGQLGGITIIKRRMFVHKSAYFKICHWILFCKKSLTGSCPFAHSMVERDVWMCERDGDLSQEQVVDKCNAIMFGPAPSQSQGFRLQDNSRPAQPYAPGASQPEFSETEPPARDLCPYNVQVLCGTCWKNGTRSKQDGSQDKCIKGHNHWHQIKIFMLLPDLKEIRPLPLKIPIRLKFVICKYVLAKKRCDYSLGGPCQFAHSEKEKDVWIWMCQNNIKSLDELAEESLKAEKAKSKISQGESVVAVSRMASKPLAPSDFQVNSNYCQYCGIQCNSEKQWDDHCASERHNFNVNSDKDHQWNFRQPPWGIPGSSYELCARHITSESCQYSHVQEMYNLCKYAHSQEELDEWKERYEWRQMKRDMAKQQKVFSYMDELLDKYESTDSGISVLSEEVNGVAVQCADELHVYKEEKNAVVTWSFIIRSQFPLLKTALLLDKDRLHFTIQMEDGRNHQIAQGDVFEDVDNHGNDCYRVIIQFTGRMFGSFSQWVIFDFGMYPVVVRKLSVEVGNHDVHNVVKSLRQKLSFDRWTSQNREIVRQPEPTEPFDDQLLQRYKAPDASERVVTQDSIIAELNRNNYIHKMHKLLELEELTRHQIISSYNICTTVQIQNNISLTKGSFYARPGELFMRVPLSDNLTEDTNAGRLILTSVKKIWFAPSSESQKRVFEANILDSSNYDFDGRGKEYIYLCVPPVCVQALGLEAGSNVEVEVQFQMNRIHFCRMHFAVDCLENTDIVFPDIVKVNPQWNERHIFKISSKVLNEDQMKAVRHIVAEHIGYSPPFIMYGPFGTGKTETLAQAAMVLVKESSSARILICAQSNSAADRYISNYLDPFLKKFKLENKLRRVYFKERRVNTVWPEVQKYCAITDRGDNFIPPSREDIMQHSLVITTVETSLQLLHLNLRGYFTHIFVDEAAQVLECETIMPLSLATEKTCIVLTGDHMQISPRVYSPEARKLNFHVSLLQRLYRHYESFREQLNQRNSSPLNIFLSINYRTKMEILRFISAIFYGGPDQLKAQGSIPSVVEITPLVFYAVQGCEIQEADSTSYYNISEIQEVVERVDELYINWPVEWGPRKAEDIMVVTAYYDQVLQIRNALRKKRRELRSVNVSRINDVQGKEFRALFISTCRTRHLLESDRIQNFLQDTECDGDIGDFGFLSDPKLLNTALTRAQSFVAIVGDPVALCSIGECVQVWRTYIKHCHNMKSLHPRTLTYESIKNQVINLQMSPEGQRLKMIMEMNRQSNRMPRLIPAGGKKTHREDQQSWSASSQIPSAADKQNSKTMHPTPGRLYSLDDRDVDFMIEPDEIIKHLAKEVVKADQLRALQDKARTQGILPPKEDSIETDDEVLNIECIKVKEHKGYAVVYYNLDRERESRKRKLLSEADAGVDFDSDDDIDHEYLDDFLGKMECRNYGVRELNKLLENDPDHYKYCILNIESSQRMFASVVDFTSSVQEIKIGSRRLCGHAFHQDEVVVEILTPDKDVTGADVGDDGVNGQVVGILRRAMDPHYRSFVCTVEVNNTGIMIPINRGLPKIYNLSTKTRMQKAKKGHVCVYQFTKDKEITFSHYEKIDPSDPQGKLFLVRYLKWEPSFYSPLGIVIGVINAGRTVEEGVAILDIEHNVHRKYKQETETEVKTLYHHDYQLPRDVYQTRHNITDRWCFTVDAPSTNDLDDALSIDQLPDGNYEVGVHIADVSYFVKRNSCIDAEALQRMTSLYPLNDDPVHMLPQRLSVDLCSLKPGKDRLTLSIFLSVTGTGEITKVYAKKCIINSKQRFSYQEVEDILHDPAAAETDYLKSCILVLYQIAQLWRSNRLGNGSHVVSLDLLDRQTPKAHQMIEDLMITTNHEVAKKLLERFPQTTPLKCQKPLNPEKAEEWKSQHASSALNTVALTKPFLEGQKTCSCRVACTCIFSYIRKHGINAQSSLDVPKDLWNTICEASDVGNLELVQHLILDPKNYPQLALAQSDLNKICSKSNYACSGDLDPVNRGHFSLNLDVYTTFISPIRRYMDLVVHRLVEAMIDHRPCPYSKLDLQTLCIQNTDALTRANKYHQDIYSLHLSAALRDKPLVLYPVIENCDDRNLTLQFPTVKEIPPKHRNISMSLLMPRERPKVTDDPKEVSLKWQERIYDASKDKKTKGMKGPTKLDPDRYIVKIPAFQWQRLLTAIRSEDFEKLQDSLSSIHQQVESFEIDGHFAEDVCSEVSRNGKINHFVEFSLSFHSCMVLRVQVASELSRGLLCPTVQLLGLTPSLDVCLEHRSSPMNCFSTVTVVSASRQTYADEAAYQKSWLPILGIESASNAVTNQESVYIHNIHIEWARTQSALGITDVIGTFHLPLEFCKEHQIKFATDVQFDSLIEHLNSTLSQSYFLDYLCVRYTGLSIPCGPNVAEKISAVLSEDKPVCWVGHCCVTSVTKEKSGQLIVQLKLHQSAVQFPHLLLSNGPTTSCTIEWIPRTLPDRRMDFAVRCLQEGSELAKDIATGRKPVDNLSYRDVDELRRTQFDTLLPLNSTQEDAIQQALKQPFTVIQGPPGTGKSLTSVHLARRFVERNRSASVHPTDSQPQVLFCGPSNKSVDVIAGYLLGMGPKCPRVVQVYSERIEQLEFPLPDNPIPPKKAEPTDILSDPSLKKIALHHLIRQPSNIHHQTIVEYDMLFSLYPDDITRDQVADYLRILTLASKIELQKAEIVLCTCSASASPKMSFSTNVMQIIIDECGMCMEPESMIPIVLFRGVEQIVLFGDHKQLRPIVTNQTAKDLGLDKSLCERYSEKAIMLSTQYRMNEGIAEFPSYYCYDGKLQCGTQAQHNPAPLKFWPNGNNKPVTFCHVVGKEEPLTVATAEGNVQSKSNEMEVHYAVSLILVFKCDMNNEDLLSMKSFCPFTTF